MSADLLKFLETHKTDSIASQTHTVLTQYPFKVLIHHEDIPDFLSKYHAHLGESAQTHVNTITITEKVKATFPMFADLDFDVDDCTEQTPAWIVDRMRDLVRLLTEAVADTLGQRADELRCVTAFRTFYRCHVVFPDAIVQKRTAKNIVKRTLAQITKEFPDFTKWSKVVDQSVHNSGLRMLGSPKGKMGAKPNGKSPHALHVATFDKLSLDVPYVDTYEVGQLTDGPPFSQTRPVTLQDLVDCTIISDKEPILVEDEDVDPPGKTTAKKRKSADESMANDEQGDDAYPLPEREVNYYQTYLKDALVGLQVDPTIRRARKFQKSGNIEITLVAQPCVFAGRQHQRTAAKGDSALYVLLTPKACTLRCFSKCHETRTLPLPKEVVIQRLDESSVDSYLIKSLYRQTDEAVSEFIFHLVKDNIAASPLGVGHILYYFSPSHHRWVQRETLFDSVMSEKGVVQSAYRAYIARAASDESLSETALGELKAQWAKLEWSLQMNKYARGSLYPVLCRKLEQYWRDPKTNADFVDRLDNNPNYLCFANGVFDMRFRDDSDQPMVPHVRPGRPSDLLSMTTGIKYKPYGQFTEEMKWRLLEFLSSIFVDEEERAYILKQTAMALNGTQSTAQFFLYIGDGANGKTTWMRLIMLAFGDYFLEIPVTLFTHPRPPSNSPTPDLVMIKNKRVVNTSEINEKDTLFLATVKWVTGGELIVCRNLYDRKSVAYRPQCMFTMCLNTLPAVTANSDDFGTWRRLSQIKFRSTFVEAPSGPMQFKAVDNRTMNETVDSLKEVFMALLVDNYCNPRKVKKPIQFEMFEKAMRSKNDLYKRFADEFIVRDEDEFSEASYIYRQFADWIREMRFSRQGDVTYDVFEQHMTQTLGPLTIVGDKKGWPVTIKPRVAHILG